MRVDFTNLLGYWDDLTDEPASKKKRDVYADHLSQPAWRSKIGKAKRRHADLRKRKVVGSQAATTTNMGEELKLLEKRWFGKFIDWLGRLVRSISASMPSPSFSSSGSGGRYIEYPRARTLSWTGG